jgi:hypothetical protein
MELTREQLAELRKISLEGSCCGDCLDTIAARDREIAELEATLDLMHQADMRGCKMWQDAHPGNDLVWPDRGKMIFWLLEQLSTLRAAVLLLLWGGQ